MTAEKPTFVRYQVLAVACSLAVLTYVQRQGFNAATPYIKQDLGWHDEQMGYFLAVEMDISTYAFPFSILRGFNTWVWLLAFIGLAAQYLDFNNGFLKYANEAVLPFYILHQTVIVVVGFFIRAWPLAVFPKYLFLALVSFAIIMLLYEGVVKRLALTRYLFGMKNSG